MTRSEQSQLAVFRTVAALSLIPCTLAEVQPVHFTASTYLRLDSVSTYILASAGAFCTLAVLLIMCAGNKNPRARRSEEDPSINTAKNKETVVDMEVISFAVDFAATLVVYYSAFASSYVNIYLLYSFCTFPILLVIFVPVLVSCFDLCDNSCYTLPTDTKILSIFYIVWKKFKKLKFLLFVSC